MLGSLAALGAAVAAVAVGPSGAAADTLPGITLPGITTITVSVPTLTLPTTTATTTTSATTTATTTTATTTTATTTTATTAPASTVVVTTTVAAGSPGSSAPAAPAAPSVAAVSAASTDAKQSAAVGALAGAKQLAGGAISIPVSSVRKPSRLRILAATAPQVVRSTTRAVALTVRVVDTRGYVVRGARVTVSGSARAKLRRAAARVSAADGVASLIVRGRFLVRTGQRAVIHVRAVDPKAPKLASTSIALRLPTLGAGVK